MGLNVFDVRLTNRDGDGVVVHLDQDSRPDGGYVLSQTIAAGAFRKQLGRMWVQAGPAMAIRGVGTRTIKASRLLDTDVRLAGAAGAGIAMGTLFGRPLELSLDVAGTQDGDLYQLTTSLTGVWF